MAVDDSHDDDHVADSPRRSDEFDGVDGVDVPGESGAADDVDAHTRLSGSRAGRVAIALVTVVGAFWIVAPNLPVSAVRDRLDSAWSPADDIGLVQDWAVFSPDPRHESLDVRARIVYDDGTVAFWDVPEFDPVVGAYREYRWNKWQERIRLDDQADLWPSTAEWIADHNQRDGTRPASVTLIRRWIVHEPLTADGIVADSGWNEYEFYTWERPS